MKQNHSHLVIAACVWLSGCPVNGVSNQNDTLAHRELRIDKFTYTQSNIE